MVFFVKKKMQLDKFISLSSLHILHAVQSACEAQNIPEIRGFRFFLEGDMLSARNQVSLCGNSMIAPKALVIYPNVPQSCYFRTAP